jgi:hypothetical protein
LEMRSGLDTGPLDARPERLGDEPATSRRAMPHDTPLILLREPLAVGGLLLIIILGKSLAAFAIASSEAEK